MHSLVFFITNEDGEPDKPVWHFVRTDGPSPHALCCGQVFGYGEGAAQYKTKQAKKGGVTCEECIAIIKGIKAIKL